MTEQPNTKLLEEAINQLTRAIQLYRYYGTEHQVTLDAINMLSKSMDQALFNQEVLTIGIIGDELAFDKEPMYELSAKKKGFIEYFKSIGIQKIRFLRGIEPDEFSKFISILPLKADSPTVKQDFLQQFQDLHLQHIVFGDITVKPKDDLEELKERKLEFRVRKDYLKSVNYFTKTYKDLKTNQKLNVQNARQIVVGLMNNLFKNKNLLLMLTSMKLQDEDTFEHGVNVAIFTLMQGEILGLEKKLLVDVGMAALLHDAGNMINDNPGISDAMVPDDFSFGGVASDIGTGDSFDQDVRGAKLLLETEGIGSLAAITAFEHGMNFDLSGEHTKIYGKHLNLISMMISISDYYDKLRKQPFYYEAGGPEKAYNMMMDESGKKFHPDLLENFFSVIGIFPPGTLVEVDTGEVALVIQASVFDIRRPQVEILYDSNGNRYENPQIV
ncbi:HD-GYP domain-containing protein, partial [bacterium]